MATKAPRILYVDDDPDITEIAATALEQIGGYEVTVCRSGAEACTRAKQLRPELIILDINMPGLDGPATLEGLREIDATSSTPVIFISGDARARAVARRYERGMLGLIEKPFDPLRLPELVAGLWQRERTQAAPELELKLDALRARFRRRLPGRMEELRRAWTEAVAAGFDAPTLGRVHRLAHNLAGASGAHGMDALSDRLARATAALRQWDESGHSPGVKERSRVEALLAEAESDPQVAPSP